LSVKNYTVYYF